MASINLVDLNSPFVNTQGYNEIDPASGLVASNTVGSSSSSTAINSLPLNNVFASSVTASSGASNNMMETLRNPIFLSGVGVIVVLLVFFVFTAGFFLGAVFS